MILTLYSTVTLKVDSNSYWFYKYVYDFLTKSSLHIYLPKREIQFQLQNVTGGKRDEKYEWRRAASLFDNRKLNLFIFVFKTIIKFLETDST